MVENAVALADTDVQGKVTGILDGCHAEARSPLGANAPAVHALANAPRERRYLDVGEVRSVIADPDATMAATGGTKCASNTD